MPPSTASPQPQQYHHHHFQPRPMSPATSSPMPKSSHPHRTSSQESTDSIRKRVCKACDRCRLKKSKCDGSSPCSRCKADNAICVFGERKKSHDKVYPKGYVEMLEQQQGQLVQGLRVMYQRLLDANAWSGPVLAESTDGPLTHDILAALNLLEVKSDGSGELETFEDDCDQLQKRLLAAGAGYVARRRGSVSSESEHSQHSGQAQPVESSHSAASRGTAEKTPASAQENLFRGSFAFAQSPSPKRAQSPMAKPEQSPKPGHYARLQQLHLQQQHQQVQARQASRQDSPITNDVPMFQTPWAFNNNNNVARQNIMQSTFALETPRLMDGGIPEMDDMFGNSQFEDTMAFDGFNSNAMSMMTSQPTQFGPDFGFVDPMDFEMNKYVAVQ